MSLDKDLIENDWVLIQLLGKKYTKDSILNGDYRFDFYRNDSLVKQAHFTLENLFEENGEWYAQSGFKYEETSKYSSFLTISNGYPACGYAHKHLLFDIKNNTFNLIYDYETMFDGGWGSNVEFFEIDDNFIISRKTNFWPNEESTSNEEIGVEELSDSIHFKFINNKWIETYITPKDTIYKSRKISFNKFHNIQE
ncbi:hypothetical protein ACFO3U_00650 [Flavobacterium ponti]|uniref:Uncharacterized protein n=1 Tax=Flavobacterium ponti TaxID=665133 RepID=A0ABV9P3L9_9FLAO